MTSIGLAMIAHNSADIMERALNPVIDYVDDMAIVLGGKSSDDTPKIARRYTDKVVDFNGPIDDEGHLLDFGAARQQSFDLLDTDWALVVDTDDIWNGVNELHNVVDLAQSKQQTMILLPYHLSPDSMFLQGRLMQRDSGRWIGPIHEHFERKHKNNLIVARPEVRQEHKGDNQERVKLGIRIAENWLKQYPDDYRAIAQLIGDYRAVKDYDKAIRLANHYFELPDNGKIQQRSDVAFTAGLCHLNLEQWWQTLHQAQLCLSIMDLGPAWTLLAEAAYQLAAIGESRGMAHLALCATDNALRAGNPRTTTPYSRSLVTSAPYHIKAKALIGLNRKQEALSVLELGLAIKPNDEQMKILQLQLCKELEVIP